MQYASGDILTPNGFTPGYIAYNNDGIQDIQLNSSPPHKDITGLIVPSFINSHTHLGDAFIALQKYIIPDDIDTAVAPPNGLKHRLLATTPTPIIQDGIDQALQYMINHNTSWFIDFREGGLPGLTLIQQSLKHQSINKILLARPTTLSYHAKEIEHLLKHSDGIGLSSISDWNYSDIKKIAETTHTQNKIFALHASEKHREDIDQILDLKPNLLIHMTKATKNDFSRVSDAQIPLVICPRSNKHFHLTPPYHLLKQNKIILLLGTDNAMLTPPNILKELHYLMQQTTLFTKEQLLNMITYAPRKALNLEDHIPGLNLPSSFVVLHCQSLEPITKIQWSRGKP